MTTTTEPCRRPGCGAVARRFPDELSYALDQHVWVCVVGHRTAGRPVPDLPRTAALAQFQRVVDRTTGATREARLSAAFVTLTDRMTAGVDVDELLRTLVEAAAALPGPDAAGALLLDADGRLDVVTASDGDDVLIGLARLGADDGPGRTCLVTGTAVTVDDVTVDGGRWPAFAAAAGQHGFPAVHAAPMRLHDEVVGVLLLVAASPAAFEPDDRAAVQALADLAAVGVLLARLSGAACAAPAGQGDALDARVLIEQAKGVLAERDGVSVHEALAVMRMLARRTRAPLRDIARQVVGGIDQAAEPVPTVGSRPGR